MVPICAGWARCQRVIRRGYFFSIVWGLETAPEGSLQPRHHYLVKIWDNHTVARSSLVKVPPQLISESNLFLHSPVRTLWKGFFLKACGQVDFCVQREQRGIMSYRVNWEREDVVQWFWLCPDNGLLSHLTENYFFACLKNWTFTDWSLNLSQNGKKSFYSNVNITKLLIMQTSHKEMYDYKMKQCPQPVFTDIQVCLKLFLHFLKLHCLNAQMDRFYLHDWFFNKLMFLFLF